MYVHAVKQLIEIDAERGGHSALERAALAGVKEALRLQRNSTTQPVRQRLFGIAADYTATAVWSLIDARNLDTANAHLELQGRTSLPRPGQDALSQVRGDQVPPEWIAFYAAAELYSITAIVRDHVGDPAQAEAASHRALSALPESYRRNRANATARLALAQPLGATGGPAAVGPARSRWSCRWTCSACPSGGSSGR